MSARRAYPRRRLPPPLPSTRRRHLPDLSIPRRKTSPLPVATHPRPASHARQSSPRRRTSSPPARTSCLPSFAVDVRSRSPPLSSSSCWFGCTRDPEFLFSVALPTCCHLCHGLLISQDWQLLSPKISSSCLVSLPLWTTTSTHLFLPSSSSSRSPLVIAA